MPNSEFVHMITVTTVISGQDNEYIEDDLNGKITNKLEDNVKAKFFRRILPFSKGFAKILVKWSNEFLNGLLVRGI